MESPSPLMRRFVIAPVIFIIFMQIISFFVRMIEISDTMYYIMIAMMSVPVFLYMVIGGGGQT
jgi:hypothetical protein